MNVGIVGCGDIAENHVSFIKRMPQARIVGIVDSDQMQLEKFCRKHNIRNSYKSLQELLDSQKVEVLHILTPPFSHKEIAKAAINKGIHLYIEKPVTLTSGEVREIYKEAQSAGVKVCGGYSMLFEPMFIESSRLMSDPGFGKVIYVECHYGMDMRRYDRLKTNKDNEVHWSFHLPGGFHQNYISHPLYLLIRLIGKPRKINLVSRSTGALPQNLTDDIRVLIEGERAAGLLSLSYSCEPYQNYMKIFGEKKAIKIDWLTRTKTLYRDVKLPAAVTKVFYSNLSQAYQLQIATIRNTFNLATKRLVPYQGIKNLIEKFYQSIASDGEVPVPKELVITTEQMAERILKRCQNLHLNVQNRPGSQQDITQKETVLVTGASGFVGLAAVKRLVDEGYRVKAFVRKLSYIDKLEEMGVEIIFGDIRHYESFKEAAEGVDIIIHLAAAMKVPAAEFEEITVGGVENLIRITRENTISKVIYMSSMSVYDVKDCERDQVLKEDHILERKPKERGAYSLSKTEAEKLVLKELDSGKSKWTILRPAVIFGPGKEIFTNSIGFSLSKKLRLIIGPSDGKLRLIHVDDVVDAVALSLKNDVSGGKIYNIVHPDRISKKEYLNNYVIPKQGKGLNICFPYSFFYFGAACVEFIFPLFKRKPFLTRYRLMSSQKDVIFDTSRIRSELDWKPKYKLDQYIKSTFDIN